MNPDEIEQRLSRISTVWTNVLQAHGGPANAQAAAQAELIERYQRAIYRYLLGALRDPDAADEVFQEFVLQFLQGGLRRADPERGRFRDYLKSALIHLVNRHRKRELARAQPVDSTMPEPAAPTCEQDDLDEQFTSTWREELLARAWAGLAEVQQQTGQPFYAVLQLRSQQPHLPSGEMAKRLTDELKPGQPFTDSGIRKTLERARERFAELLLDEIARSLEGPSLEQVEQELIDLRLLPYCRTVLERRRHG